MFLAVWVSTPAYVFREEDAQKPLVRPLGGPFEPQTESAAPLSPTGGAYRTIVAQESTAPECSVGCWDSGATHRSRPILVRAGVDLVRRRRDPDRSHPTEPSPSTHQNCASQFWQSSSGAVDCVVLVFP